MINNIVTEVFNLNIYAYYLLTNRSTLVIYIVQTVYVLHHCKYIAICSIDVTVDDFDRFDLFFFELDNLPSPKFYFLTLSQKLIFAISFLFQLNFIYIFSFQLTIILFGVNVTDVNFFSMCIETMCRGVAKNGGTRGEISWWHLLPTKK